MSEAFTIFNVVRVLMVATISFFLALIVEPFWVRVLRRYFAHGKEIEKSDNTFWGPTPVFNALHKKKEGTPTMGGFIVWFSVVLVTVFFWILHGTADGFWSKVNFLSRAETYLPLAFLIIAGLMGMADDIAGIFKRRGFGLIQRLGLFSILAGIGGWWFVVKLGRDALNVPFVGDVIIGPFWYFLVFMVIMLSTSFAADITDGLDGLIGGTFLSVFAALGAIAFDQGRMDMVAFIAAILGALIAFLWFNIYPAKYFMGDTGVMALGFVAGSTAMLLNVPLLLPFIAIIPLIESLSVIAQTVSKKIRGKKIFISTPIHHTFEALGWHESQITMRFWMVNAIGAIVGLTLFLADSKIPPLTHGVFSELVRTMLH